MRETPPQMATGFGEKTRISEGDYGGRAARNGMAIHHFDRTSVRAVCLYDIRPVHGLSAVPIPPFGVMPTVSTAFPEVDQLSPDQLVADP